MTISLEMGVMNNLINIQHLQSITAIIKFGSISKAADVAHLSQSAVSQSLQKLERQLKGKLFTRGAKGVIPTPLGIVFIGRIEQALLRLQLMESVVAKENVSHHFQRYLTGSQLAALIHVVAQGSFRRAAQQLNLTQPTIHRAVSNLESLVGQKLFSRSAFGVEPTWQARQLARHGGLFLREIENAYEVAQSLMGSHSGKLVIGALPLARSTMIPVAVTQLLQTYPKAQIQIIDGPYDEQFKGLLRGSIDVIVGALRDASQHYEIQQSILFTEPLNIVVKQGHSLFQHQGRLSAYLLAELDWVAPRHNTPARSAFNDFFKREGLVIPEHVIECSSLVAIRGLLMNSNRAAILPARQVELEVASSQLAVLPYPLVGTERSIGVTTLRGWQPTEIQSRFVALLHERQGNNQHTKPYE